MEQLTNCIWKSNSISCFILHVAPDHWDSSHGLINLLYNTKCDSKGTMHRCSSYLIITMEEKVTGFFSHRYCDWIWRYRGNSAGLLNMHRSWKKKRLMSSAVWLAENVQGDKVKKILASASACAGCAWVRPHAPASQSVSWHFECWWEWLQMLGKQRHKLFFF